MHGPVVTGTDTILIGEVHQAVVVIIGHHCVPGCRITTLLGKAELLGIHVIDHVYHDHTVAVTLIEAGDGFSVLRLDGIVAAWLRLIGNAIPCAQHGCPVNLIGTLGDAILLKGLLNTTGDGIGIRTGEVHLIIDTTVEIGRFAGRNPGSISLLIDGTVAGDGAHHVALVKGIFAELALHIPRHSQRIADTYALHDIVLDTVVDNVAQRAALQSFYHLRLGGIDQPVLDRRVGNAYRLTAQAVRTQNLIGSNVAGILHHILRILVLQPLQQMLVDEAFRLSRLIGCQVTEGILIVQGMLVGNHEVIDNHVGILLQLGDVEGSDFLRLTGIGGGRRIVGNRSTLQVEVLVFTGKVLAVRRTVKGHIVDGVAIGRTGFIVINQCQIIDIDRRIGHTIGLLLINDVAIGISIDVLGLSVHHHCLLESLCDGPMAFLNIGVDNAVALAVIEDCRMSVVQVKRIVLQLKVVGVTDQSPLLPVVLALRALITIDLG